MSDTQPVAPRLRWPRGVAESLLVLGVSAALFLFLQPFGARRNRALCQTQMKKLGLALVQYTRDYDERLPLKSNWVEATAIFNKDEVLHCPLGTVSYVYNDRVSGIDLSVVSRANQPRLVSAYETEAAVKTDAGQAWPESGVHIGGINTVFFDGHVKWMTAKPIFTVPEVDKWQAQSEKQRVEWLKKRRGF